MSNHTPARRIRGIEAYLAQKITYPKIFVSGELVATGVAQNIAHGLGKAPDAVTLVPVGGHDGAGGTGTQFPTITGVDDATNVVVTCTAGAKFTVIAFAA